MAKAVEKKRIRLDDGSYADAQAPVIVSASRSTDIPAFYADWFFERLRRGYSSWTNPFNGVRMYVGYEDVRFIVFWSKNPRPLLSHLDYLRERGIGCYIQYTLNDYEAEGLERGVRPLGERIETFRLLVERLGKGHVVWRFDPLILTDRIDMQTLLNRIEHIGDALYGYTEKLVFSFADIVSYRKVKGNLERAGIRYVDWTEEMMREFAGRLASLNRKWGYELATCGERIDLSAYGIAKNHCVDDRLIVRFGYHDARLMDFLGATRHAMPQAGMFEEFGAEELPAGAIPLPDGTYALIGRNNADKGQREACGCMKSKDIGQYNTCPHLCEYCYANASKESAVANWRRHQANPHSDTITG